jgi:hypothetical protein
MSTGAVFFAHKKQITERNSHLAGEASGSSISNGCQAKTERRRQLAGVGPGRGGTKLHASVAGSRVTAFLATAAPWEPYFTDNPRTIACGPCQSCHSWVEVLQNSRPYFTASSVTPPNLEGQVPLFISPGTGWPSYTPGHWFPVLSPLIRY